jgi:hypothetical protein
MYVHSSIPRRCRCNTKQVKGCWQPSSILLSLSYTDCENSADAPAEDVNNISENTPNDISDIPDNIPNDILDILDDSDIGILDDDSGDILDNTSDDIPDDKSDNMSVDSQGEKYSTSAFVDIANEADTSYRASNVNNTLDGRFNPLTDSLYIIN